MKEKSDLEKFIERNDPYGDGYDEKMQERTERRKQRDEEYFMNLQCPRG